MPVYSIDDITVFVDGVELEGLAADTGVTPKDKDNIKPIQDWAGINEGLAKMNNRDTEGTIALLASSNSNKLLLRLAETKRPFRSSSLRRNQKLRVGRRSPLTSFFFYPEVKPDKEENILKYDFIGTGFKIEY